MEQTPKKKTVQFDMVWAERLAFILNDMKALLEDGKGYVLAGYNPKYLGNLAEVVEEALREATE